MPKVELEPVIGLEIHLELNTKSKLFCSCANEESPIKPNINICPICLGHPGVLPVINKSALEKVLTIGIALEGAISQQSYFDRKNYFYPDLPKGYQISQYKLPLVQDGFLKIEIGTKEKIVYPVKSDKVGAAKPQFNRVNLERIHLEEDTAKLLHNQDQKYSLVDFNRSGVPLLEIVTKPKISSPQDAKVFIQELQLLARYLNISNADMEHGQMRCDTNISLRPKGSKKMFAKTEIKNLNSFKSVEDSLNYEIERQTQLWNNNKTLKIQTTRGWDEKKNITYEQRRKEEEQDYRYFPEPDLPPLSFKSDDTPLSIDKIRKSLPELPIAKRQRFIAEYGFNTHDVKLLVAAPSLADFTENVISEMREWLSSLETVEGSEQEIWEKNKKKLVSIAANWLINRFLPLIKDKEKDSPITPENFAEFVIRLYEKKISSTVAQKILEKMVETGADPDHVMENYQLQTIDDTHELKNITEKVIVENPDIVEKFKKGKKNVIQFLVGQVMKKTKGQADPETVTKLLEKELR